MIHFDLRKSFGSQSKEVIPNIMDGQTDSEKEFVKISLVHYLMSTYYTDEYPNHFL